MKTVQLLSKTGLLLLFALSVIFPVVGYSDAYTNLLSWAGWGISSKVIQTSGEINKLSFRGSHPPLHLTYGDKAVGESSETVSELGNNQFYIIQNGQPGDLFNFCFRTPPALSVGNLPSPPAITQPVTGLAMSGRQDAGVKLAPLAPGSGRWQYQYSVRWRLPTGHQSLVLAVEDNHNGWVIEPECSGIVSESSALPSSSGSNTSGNKKTSFVDIFFRNTQAEKTGSDNPDDNSRFSGPLVIPGVPETADNSELFSSPGGGGFGGDDSGDLFKKRPGHGMAPLYAFEWMSELFSSIILVPAPGDDGQTVKKQIWDTRIVLKIKQGWNEQSIIISQALWNKIRAANLERSSGFFLALSRNPDNPEAVFDHYLSNNPVQVLQTEDYQSYEQQVFILSPKQLRRVSVFPGHCPTGVSCPGGSGQAKKQTADLRPSSYTRSEYGRQYQDKGSFGGRSSDEDDGSGGAPNKGGCIACQNPAKPVYAFKKCRECLDRETDLLEEEPVIEQPLEIRRGGAIPVSAPKAVDTSAVTIFQWFKNLQGRRGDYFYHSEYYNLPQLYKLLTHSFLSDRDTLSKFHSKWNEFIRGNVGLHGLISRVGELVKSQGGREHVEVARIVKALAFYREEFENEDGLRVFRDDLKTYLATNNILPTVDPDQVLYSGLDSEQKAELINFIYQTFKQTGDLLKEETVPSQFYTIKMFNGLAREVYDKYYFGLPDISDHELSIILWGYPGSDKYSFITPSNMGNVFKSPSHQSLQGLALAITGNEPEEAENVRAMFTALTLIRSMFESRAETMFPKYAGLSKKVDHDQLNWLRNFTIKAREQLVEILRVSDPEQKDEFIRNMFLIFGVVPLEIMNELTQESEPGLVLIKKKRVQVAAHPQHKKSKRRHQGSGSVSMDSALPDDLYMELATNLSTQWKDFARRTGVLKRPHIENIDADYRQVLEKAIQMLYRWRQVKKDGTPTFRNLLEILGEMDLNKMRFDIMERYGL